MMRTSRGFTLLELMTVIAIIVILYGMMPEITTPLLGTQQKRARTDIEMIAVGLWGPSRDYQGFVGDIGITNSGDATSIQASGFETLLVYPPSSGTYLPALNYSGVTAGWNGPYTGFDPKSLKLDPWNQPWEILPNGQVHSWGPDRANGTDDDLYAPIAGPLEKGTTGTVAVVVHDLEGRILTGDEVEVILWTPDTGASVNPRGSTHTVPVVAQSDNTFVATDVPPGRHLVEVKGSILPTKICDGISQGSCLGLYGQGVASVIGGSLATLEVQVHP
jgi:prepilin-type N-terminal cleavage/methylation domain-containing protein